MIHFIYYGKRKKMEGCCVTITTNGDTLGETIISNIEGLRVLSKSFLLMGKYNIDM
jgi:hypothetical protein